jgi:hypothetical protein
MLDQPLIDRITASIAAYLAPRGRTLTDNLRAAAHQLAARGMIGSGNAAVQFARIGADELTVRAKIIWNAIQRAYEAACAPLDSATRNDLQGQITQHVNAHSFEVRAIVNGVVPPLPGQIRSTIITHIEETIATVTREILAQLSVEVGFYVDELRRQAAHPLPTGVTINAGQIGAVQTGAYALAHISMSAQESAKLVEALDALRKALRASSEATPEQRAQGEELAGDLITAVKAERPNGPKISGLLGGLAATVQTVASLRPAWELVRDAAIAAGVTLSALGVM